MPVAIEIRHIERAVRLATLVSGSRRERTVSVSEKDTEGVRGGDGYIRHSVFVEITHSKFGRVRCEREWDDCCYGRTKGAISIPEEDKQVPSLVRIIRR